MNDDSTRDDLAMLGPSESSSSTAPEQQKFDGVHKPLPRTAERERVTRETDIAIALNLDSLIADPAMSEITTGVPFLDHMLDAFARHGRFTLAVRATGDTRIDDHHTVEDVGLVLGQTFLAALGERRGIARFGYAYAPMDESLARAVVDISGRPYLVFAPGMVNLTARLGTFDPALVEEFWRAFTTEARLALHLDILRSTNSHHAIEAVFKAAGLALCAATRVDSQYDGVPSTKGVLG
ncbi:MAG: imidazoleglycerol-phosphate dehydratase HisB [Ktedonobacterales bacterium]